MKFKRALLSLALIFSICFVGTTKSYAIFEIEKKTTASLIGDAKSGALFVAENIDEPLSIASISKLMTYYLVKEKIAEGKLKMEDKVKISINASREEGSSLNLKAGEQISIKDLLDGLMVVSGNDSAVALAEVVAESESKFVTMMNEKAKELGLQNATFTNASGLTKNGQDNKMSTRDIFTLSKAIIEKYPEVLEYAKTTVLEQPSRNFKKESTIPLVGQVEGVDGLKTGHTDEAGYCLVSTMKIKKGETEFRVISVLMGAKTKADRAQYMKDMLNYAKQNIETRKIVDSEKFVKKVETKSASQGFIELVPKENLERASMKGINYETEVTVDDVKLPLKKGDKVGEIKIKNSKEVIATVDLVAKEDYSKVGFVRRIGRFFKTVFEVVETILP
ncbi:D-alanyl-D-alanine carboxypeptidase family protein [Parvimonas micra]|uniref:serine-type D-Ala-D-Ala carboxypeptidase n=1 Tax=Parvimonas micra TaxID=33033 RepID=A0AAX3K6A6_9FIRM|nr:D-alanyl-D-alanine carboxypeptidase family protein [Parvimonas micra]WBB30737.1 D-alanyl-D-alanine carboxypeptidase [Parvimonas micra]